MISKFNYLLFVLFFSLPSFCQNNQGSDIYFDVDNFPVFKFDSLNDKSLISYYLLKEEKVSVNIHFKGGYEALSTFCDSLYFHRKDYNHEELNAQALYAILFDKNLHIKEVRIIKRIAYNNLKYAYDDLIKRILYLTEERWSKTTDEDSNWYFYLGHFNLR